MRRRDPIVTPPQRPHYSPLRLADVQSFVDVHKSGQLDYPLCAGFVLVSALLFGASVRCFAKRMP